MVRRTRRARSGKSKRARSSRTRRARTERKVTRAQLYHQRGGTHPSLSLWLSAVKDVAKDARLEKFRALEIDSLKATDIQHLSDSQGQGWLTQPEWSIDDTVEPDDIRIIAGSFRKFLAEKWPNYIEKTVDELKLDAPDTDARKIALIKDIAAVEPDFSASLLKIQASLAAKHGVGTEGGVALIWWCLANIGTEEETGPLLIVEETPVA